MQTKDTPVQEAAHSSGPWKYERIPPDAYDDPDLAIDPHDCFWIVGDRDRGEVLASVHTTHDGDEEANARLIAAAPDLRDALRRMLDCHQAAMDAGQSSASRFVSRSCECGACGACDEARGAIAKAEGRS